MHAQVDDEEVAEMRKRQETHVFWCVDYARAVDALRLKLHRIREALQKQVGRVCLSLEGRAPRVLAVASEVARLTVVMGGVGWGGVGGWRGAPLPPGSSLSFRQSFVLPALTSYPAHS
jgi:hypothetical protein